MRNLDRARSEVEVGLSLNPNYAPANNILGNIETYSGQPLAAIPPIERSIRLDPAFAYQYLHYVGTAYLVAGKQETASAIFKQAPCSRPNRFDTRLACLGSGPSHQIEEARQIWTELKAVNPKYSFEEHLGWLPFKRPGGH